jgi:nucleoside-diphosphate-sugar epimerase
MNVLITGGTGFIGARLARRCLQRGDRVRIYGQLNTPAENENADMLRSGGADIILGSMTEKTRVVQAVNGIDVVFHLAAAQHEANVPDQVFWDVNLAGTETMLAASAAGGVKRFVHGSTIGVYGSALGGVIDEESALRPDNIYGVTKLAGEKAVMAFGDRLPVVVIRISETYGPGDRRLLKLFRGIDRGAFFVIGSGDNIHHLIYIQDLIDGFLLAAENEAAVGELFVLAGKEPLTTLEMVRSVARVLDRRLPPLHAPMLPFMMAAAAMELTLRPLGIQPPLHRRRMDFFRKSFLFSSDKSARILGFTPRIAFEEGATRTAEWYRRHHLL